MQLSSYQNKLLARVPSAELFALRSHLEPVDLPKGFTLALPEQAIADVAEVRAEAVEAMEELSAASFQRAETLPQCRSMSPMLTAKP